MLQASIFKKNRKLNIYFDISVPHTVCQNEDFAQIMDQFKKGGQFDFQNNENGDMVALSCDIDRLITFMKQVMPTQDADYQMQIFEEVLGWDSDEQGSGLQINFHQNSFDTSERYWNFILAQGNFIEYFFNRLNWYLGPKNKIVAPFPLHVDLESANTCNMNCPMCYRDGMKEIGMMDMDLFKKAVDECAANSVYSIRLSWRGEALTHPKIKEMIRYATRKIKNVSFLTNAFYINDDMIDCFIENQVSYVAVSFDGIGKIYESIRHPAKFRESYQKLTMLKNKKKEAHTKLPQVRVCTIWPAIKDNPKEYYDKMKDVSDYIVCNPYINFRGHMKIKEDFICQYPWERIVIAYNGKTQCCTGWDADDIILGNVKDLTIREMWQSDLMNKIRMIHSTGRRMELNTCAKCRHGSMGDPDIEIAEIIERKF